MLILFCHVPIRLIVYTFTSLFAITRFAMFQIQKHMHMWAMWVSYVYARSRAFIRLKK